MAHSAAATVNLPGMPFVGTPPPYSTPVIAPRSRTARPDRDDRVILTFQRGAWSDLGKKVEFDPPMEISLRMNPCDVALKEICQRLTAEIYRLDVAMNRQSANVNPIPYLVYSARGRLIVDNETSQGD